MQLLREFDRMYHLIQDNFANLKNLYPEEQKKYQLSSDDEKNMGEHMSISIHPQIVQFFFDNTWCQ